MKIEQIEKEIDERLTYPDNQWDDIFNSGYSRGFREGAKWRINSVWHEASEVPERFGMCLLRKQDGYSILVLFSSTKDWKEFIECNKISIWAYVSDLLPERKEEMK